MKSIRVFSCGVLVSAFVGAAPVLGATESGSPQSRAADGGILLAGEYQVPVEEGVEPLDAPAAEVTEGNREAIQPSAEQPPANEPQPPADAPPDVQQPPLEP
jgi:hypothetical protein